MNPAYLGEMPSVERVKAEIRGRNRTDTAARQMGAFWQLQKIIETLAGPRFYRTRTPDENQLIGQYRAGYAAAAQPIEKSLSSTDRSAWWSLHSFYEVDAGFREDLLTRFFSSSFRDNYRRVEAQARERARARAGQRPGRPPQPPVAERRPAVGGTSFLLLLVIIAVVVFAAFRRRSSRGRSSPPPGTADNYYLQGVEFYKARQYVEAIQSFERSIAILPMSPAYNDLGNCHLRLEQYSEAIAAYKEAIRLKPDNSVAYFNLGTAYHESKDNENALTAFREVVRIEPDQANAWFMLGTIHYVLGHFQEAEAALQQSIRLTSDKSSLAAMHSLLSEVYIAQGNQSHRAKDYAAAIDAFRKAIALGPDAKSLARAYKFLGVTFNQADQYDDAIQALQESLKLEPNSEDAHFGLGWTYFKAKQYPNALQALKEAVRLKPDDPKTHHWIGEVYFHGMDQPEAALAAYRESLRLRPDEARTLNQMGLVHSGLEQFPEAEAAFKRAIDLRPDVALYHSNLGLLYVRMGNKEEALQVHHTLQRIESALAQELQQEIDGIFANNGTPRELILSGLISAAAGDHEAALRGFRRAISLAPDDAEAVAAARTGIGRVFLEQKRYEEALAELLEALRVEPDNVQALYELGRAYNGLKQYEPAIQALRKAIQEQPNYPEAHFGLGMILLAMGKREEAKQVSSVLAKIDQKRAEELDQEIARHMSGQAIRPPE